MSDLIEKAWAYRRKIESGSQYYSDGYALENVDLFPAWDADGHAYAIGDRVRYQGLLYKCLIAHNSQASWDPVNAVSLWAKVLVVDPDTPAEWEQPDSTNPYMKGDKVLFDGKTYESLIDNNVWSPAAYPAGWKEI